MAVGLWARRCRNRMRTSERQNCRPEMKSTRRCRSANEAGLYAETLPARGAKALGEVMLAEIGVIEEEMHVDRWF